MNKILVKRISLLMLSVFLLSGCAASKKNCGCGNDINQKAIRR